MTKVQTNKDIFYFELNSKTIFDIIGITVSIWKQHDFETIFTSKYVMNIKCAIGKGFQFRDKVYSMGVNVYFGMIRKNRPHITPNYTPGNLSFKLTIKDMHIVLQKKYLISDKNLKKWSRSNVSSKYFNSKYIYFVVYETCDKLIWIQV